MDSNQQSKAQKKIVWCNDREKDCGTHGFRAFIVTSEMGRTRASQNV